MPFDAMKHIDLKLIVTTKLYVSNFRAAQIDKKVEKTGQHTHNRWYIMGLTTLERKLFSLIFFGNSAINVFVQLSSFTFWKELDF